MPRGRRRQTYVVPPSADEDLYPQEPVTLPDNDSKEEPEAAQNEPAWPAKIRMKAPFGFIDDDGTPKMWPIHAIVEDADEIDMITERGFANFEVVK